MYKKTLDYEVKSLAGKHESEIHEIFQVTRIPNKHKVHKLSSQKSCLEISESVIGLLSKPLSRCAFGSLLFMICEYEHEQVWA